MWIELSSSAALEVERVGAKTAGVARLYQAGLPVPRGWCLPVVAEPAADLTLDVSDDAWRRPLALLRARVASLPPSAELRAAVDALCAAEDGPLVVRSSAVGEGASLSGLLTSFLGVQGPEPLLNAIQACWLSRWSDNVVRYALGRGLDLQQLRVGVLVQPLVLAQAAGGARSQAGRVTIEATWGLGRGLAEGEVVPDVWRVEDGLVREVRPGDKRLRVDLDADGGERWRQVPTDEASRLCLDEATVLELTGLVQTAEHAFGEPIDVEWTVDRRRQVWLVQARSSPRAALDVPDTGATPGAGCLEGLPASPGTAVGRARVVQREDDLHDLGSGDVLVADVLRPGALAGAPLPAALVLEAGGTTSHAATLARERGIPAVFGVRGATRLISTGAEVLVDGHVGRVVRLASK